MKPYYYVFSTGLRGLVPRVKHATAPEAQAEAERLAALHPGTAFEILKVVGISLIVSPAFTFWVDGEAQGVNRAPLSTPNHEDNTPGYTYPATN